MEIALNLQSKIDHLPVKVSGIAFRGGHVDEGLLRIALEALPHPFYVVNVSDYTIALANGAARRLGMRGGAGTCHALSHHSAVPCSSADHPCPLVEVRRTGAPVVVEHQHFDADQNLRDVEVHGYPIFDDAGQLVQLVEYCIDISARKKLERERLRVTEELQAALSQVNRLRGLLPICASCKRIRDDRGYWNEVECYISAHSEADFTHSICEECAKGLYPGLRLRPAP